MPTDPVERLIRRADRPVEPRPEFAEALLARLLADLEPETGIRTNDAKETTMTTAIAQPAAKPGGAVVRPARWRVAPRTGHRTRAWVLTHAATAALLALTLTSALFAFGTPRDWTMGSLGLFEQMSPGVATELIARARVDALPVYPMEYAGIGRFALDPGEAMTAGPDSAYGDGVYLFVVEAGSVTLAADGPAELATEPDDQSAPMAAEAVLVAGDRGAIWAGTPTTWRNDGPEPAVVLHAAIGEAVGVPAEFELTDLVKSPSNRRPAFPASFALLRLTFDPGASLPVADLPGLMMLAVDTGSLDVPIESGSGSSIRHRSFTPREGLTTDFWSIAPGGDFTNPGTEPAIVYVLLGESVADGAATPTP